MKVRAIAARDPRSNTVGTVELSCAPQGLSVIYLSASAFNEGYAPGATTQGAEVQIPWGAVDEACIEGQQLYLALDARLTPLNRLVLVNFSDERHVDHHELYRQRSMIRAATIAAIVIAALLSWVAVPRASDERPLLLAGLVAVAVGGVILALGLFADHWLVTGGVTAERARAVFFSELGSYLPTLLRRAAPPAKRGASWRWAPQTLFPRSTTAIVIALSASGLAAVLTSNWLLDDRAARERPRAPAAEEPLPEPAAPTGAPSAPDPTAIAPEEHGATPTPSGTSPTPSTASGINSAPSAPAESLGGECRCAHADSVLWRNSLPRLSPVLISQHARAHKDHTHLALDLGVVNNGNKDIGQLGLDVQFYEDGPSPSSPHRRRKNQHLFFEGPLHPGHAVKWHVESRGTRFEIENPFSETLSANGDDAAPADAFYALLSANHRPIRLHASMMLAFLGDQRAKEGALSLHDALREDEAPYLDRVLFALNDVRVCNLAASAGEARREVQACVYNSSNAPKSGVVLRLRALDRAIDHRDPTARPPIIIAEQTLHLPDTLAPTTGKVVTASIDTTNPDGLKVETFEIVVDDGSN